MRKMDAKVAHWENEIFVTKAPAPFGAEVQ
jgi:hypothetical protein